MSSHTCRRSACLLLLTGILMLVLTAPAEAVVYSFGRHPDKERLVLDFGGQAPTYSVSRTGRRELTLSVPPGAMGAPGRTPDLGGSRFVGGVRSQDGSIRIDLKSDAIGYVAFALNDQGKVVVDVFADPLGARWKPTGGPAPAAPARTAAPAATPEAAPAPQAAAEPPAPELPPVVEPEAPAPDRAAPAPAQTAAPQEAELPAEGTGAAPRAPAPESAAPAQAEPAAPAMRGTAPQQAERSTAAPLAQPKRSAVRLPYVFRGRIVPPGGEAPAGGVEVAQVAPQSAAPAAQTAAAQPAAPGQAPASSVRRSIAAPGASAPAAQAPAAAPESVAPAPAVPQAASVSPAAAPEQGSSDQREIVKRMVKNLLEGKENSKFRGAVEKPDESVGEVRRHLDAAGKGPLDGEPEIQPTNEVLPQPDAVPAEAPVAESAAESAAAPAQGQPADAGMADAAALEKDSAAVAEGETAGDAPTLKLTPEEARAKREEYMGDIMFAAKSAQSTGDSDTALSELATLLALPDVPKEMREEAMYTKADIIYSKYKDDLQAHFDDINGAYESAINFNLDSWRVPAALLRRGMLNLKVGNIPEAEAYFQTLRDKFKGDPNVPLSYYYWGDHYYRNGDYQKAADEFQYLVQVYPDSKFVREASIGLARSLRKLGYDKQAFQIVDYIEKRWPRFYVEFPPFLRLLGDAAYAVQDYGKAKGDYWTYYNIDPEGEEADIILAKLGDIYVRTGKELAARELYDKALAEFPDREGGLIAKMRLAEEGIYDEPTVEQMFTIFDRPLNLKPSQIYHEIVTDHPESPLAPLAQLKTAMWEMWNNKYIDAMNAVEDFERLFPNSDLMDRAKSVGVQAFGHIVDQLLTDENYPKIVDLWEKHAFVRDKASEMTPSAKLALALSFWKRGLPGTALELVMPFMQEEQIPKYSEMGMSLALSVFVENQAWERVLEVDSAVDQWVLGDQYRRELTYAKALALENLGRYEDSLPLWKKLGADRELSDEQRAYAIFFMARDALANEDFRKAYELAQDAYEILVRKNEDKPKIRECLSILMDVTERSGRYREAIKWADLYREQLPVDAPDRPALDYRIAGLYKKGGDYAKWRSILKDVADKSADTLYGRMAASDLQMETLNRASQEYVPQAQF